MPSELGLALVRTRDQIVEQREGVLAGDRVAVEQPPPVSQPGWTLLTGLRLRRTPARRSGRPERSRIS
jgi:hypothetical protein